MGWFIFTFLLLICTLRSTVAFFTLFFTLDLAFLFLGLAYLLHVDGAPHTGLLRAGGAFGILAAFTAWYVSSVKDSVTSFSTNNIQGTTPSPVLPTPAIHSSSFPSPTSRGLTRVVRGATRWITARLAPRCKLSSFLFNTNRMRCYFTHQDTPRGRRNDSSDRPL
jgi:hypothetical protein